MLQIASNILPPLLTIMDGYDQATAVLQIRTLQCCRPGHAVISAGSDSTLSARPRAVFIFVIILIYSWVLENSTRIERVKVDFLNDVFSILPILNIPPVQLSSTMTLWSAGWVWQCHWMFCGQLNAFVVRKYLILITSSEMQGLCVWWFAVQISFSACSCAS